MPKQPQDHFNQSKSDTFSSRDEEALGLLFKDLFYAYEAPLYKLALQLAKDSDVARDIVNDVFLKLWEIRDQLDEIRSIESFLFTMTRNKIMDYLRKVSSEERLRKAIWESMQELVDPVNISVEAKEFQRILHETVDNLPQQRKKIYQLRDDGYSYNEIAEKMHLSPHTVKNQISAAIKSLKKAFSHFLFL
ncbi:RNA polymerase sigma-70 factor [Sphingobacterium sp. LRF_L2]|uniref:RNA polymerase sigma-70 factor n=1 Tax=Sphingobacterium sp. LRF_L2 TaxID=3369421 RepID=UPI003F616D12